MHPALISPAASSDYQLQPCRDFPSTPSKLSAKNVKLRISMPHSRDPKAKFVYRLQPLKNGTKASQSLCPWLLQGPVGNRIETTNPVQAKAIFAEKKKLSAQAELKKKKKVTLPASVANNDKPTRRPRECISRKSQPHGHRRTAEFSGRRRTSYIISRSAMAGGDP